MTTTTPIKTSKVADRRTLRFARLEDIAGDVHELDRGDGDVRASGNWTPGQIVHHVAKLMEMSIDGFPAPAPLPIRLIGKLLRSSVLTKPMRAGFKIPGVLRDAAPPEDVTWNAAREYLDAMVARVEAGERMEQPSPAFGPMVHEEWLQLHCRHAEMHFSFMHPASADE